MLKSLLKSFKSPKQGRELLTELDISRVVGAVEPTEEEIAAEAEAAAQAEEDAASNIEVWKQNDLDLLQETWQAYCDNPEREDTLGEFRNALHNLHGASGAYGGGALTRLSGSLHQLVSGVEDVQQEAALINLHVQACRATSFGGNADDVADAVCDALEHQVGVRLIG
ncbi:MAG: hypothetical protein AAGJ68_00700 [Pseudomonadota bacterium]